MSQNDHPEGEGESSEPVSNESSLAKQVSASASKPSPSSYANSKGGISSSSTQQNPLLDPNIMMMSNAAATIAAVAAQAVQQMQKSSSSPSPAPNSSQQQAGLAAALNSRKPLISHSASGSTASGTSHLAALLGASASQHSSVPFQAPLQPYLGFGDTLQSSASAGLSSNAMTNALLPSMQSWSFEQLEQHVNLLQKLNQPVPQYLALLLTEAKQKQKKKDAKRVANRKSASTSRARKKALVEEMTRTNARLKRQALILALLPDLVLAITTEGEITFCSAQVERVLQHKIDDLIGAQLSSLLIPASRDALSSLVDELIKSDMNRASGDSQPTQARHGTKRHLSNQRNSSGDTSESKANDENGNENSNDSGRGSSAVAIVSEQSFPLSVVEVDSKQSARPSAEINAEQNDNSDTSTNNSGKQQMSSLTNSTRSPTVSSGDEQKRGSRGGSAERTANGKRQHSSDDSSSLSSDAKNMSKANENLDRNVRWHNRRMMGENQNISDDGPKDDVTGASVTANNATARLSSLKHFPDLTKRKEDASNGDQSSSDDSLLAGVEEKKKGENASDDSGYRESNDSREESSSSGSDTSNSNDQGKKPLTTTCRMCLIRQDLTTVWCEVTSSIRTRSADEESLEAMLTPQASAAGADTVAKEEVRELLLCLRPIRDGEKKVDESLRFVSRKRIEPEKSQEPETAEGMVSSSSGDARKEENSSEKTSTGSGSNDTTQDQPKRPPKKRILPTNGGNQQKKAKKANGSSGSKPASEDAEKSVVESLMLMNKSSQ